MALTRDVPFSQYGEDEDTIAASGDRDLLIQKSRTWRVIPCLLRGLQHTERRVLISL